VNTVVFFVIQGLMLVFFLFRGKKYSNFVYLLPIINIITDAFTFSASGAGSVFAIWRGVIQYGFFAIVMFRKPQIHSVSKVIFILIGYWLVLVVLSSEIATSFRIYTAVCLSLVMFPVGYNCISTFDDLKKLHNSLMVVLIIFGGYAVLSNFLEVGYTQYMHGSRDVIGVGWADAQLYCAPFILVLYPLMAEIGIKRKKLVNALLLCTFLLLLISLRRSAVGIAMLGYVLLFYQTGQLKSLAKYIVPVVVVAGALFLIFREPIMERVALREDKFSSSYDVSEEKRYLETILVWTDLANAESLTTSVFGTELFNSRGNYGDGALGTRVIHIDYNLILHGSGVLGLILYIGIYILLLWEAKRIQAKLVIAGLMKDKRVKLLQKMIVTFTIMSFVIGFSGQLATPTFRVITFLYLGAAFSILKNMLNNSLNGQKETSLVR